MVVSQPIWEFIKLILVIFMSVGIYLMWKEGNRRNAEERERKNMQKNLGKGRNKNGV